MFSNFLSFQPGALIGILYLHVSIIGPYIFKEFLTFLHALHAFYLLINASPSLLSIMRRDVCERIKVKNLK